MLNVTYAKCHIEVLYAECHYAKCRYAECRGDTNIVQSGIQQYHEKLAPQHSAQCHLA
jgi:hypothetical protein